MSGAFYVFPNIVATGLMSTEAKIFFLENTGVATISGASFGRNGEGFIRFSCANNIENILCAIDRIRSLVSR